MKKVGTTLLSLSELEKEIVGITGRKDELLCRRDVITSEIENLTEQLGSLETELEQGSSRQEQEEHRVKDEEAKIVERRKQLTAIGGAKVAKMVEREIDIASRSLEAMEETALKAVEEVDVLERKIYDLKERLSELEAQKVQCEPEIATELAELEASLGEREHKRDGLFNQLDARLKHLYLRVQGRYAGSPVAVAQRGSCRACFRALPSQTYNQVIAGNSLIQCPGCQRILVYME